ncbi:MAG: oligosaccharide flippase family protein [Cyclobacteriaceae bacterium]
MILFSGKVLIISFGFLATPLISRLFTPDQYGSFALFNSIIVSLALLISLRLSAVFIIVDEEDEFKKVARALSSLIIFGSLVITIIIFLFGTWIFSFFESQNLDGLWYAFGISIYLHAMRDYMGNWNIRSKQFKHASTMSVVETIGIKGTTVAIGVSDWVVVNGLILGEILGKFLHIVFQLKLFVRERINYLIPLFSLSDIWKIIKRYKEYPLFVLPSTFLVQFSTSLIIFYLSIQYESLFVGSYSMAVSLLTIPTILIAYTAQPLLTQKVFEYSLEKKSIDSILNKFLGVLIVIGTCSVFFLMLFSSPIIIFLLGKNWIVTSYLIPWMAPILLFDIIYIPLNGVLLGQKKNKEIFLISSMRLTGIFGTLFLMSYYGFDFKSGIKIFIIGVLIMNIIVTVTTVKQIKLNLSWYFKVGIISYLGIVLLVYWQIGFFGLSID